MAVFPAGASGYRGHRRELVGQRRVFADALSSSECVRSGNRTDGPPTNTRSKIPLDEPRRPERRPWKASSVEEVHMSNVVMICGSLRKGSFNRALMNALPALAPADVPAVRRRVLRDTLPDRRRPGVISPVAPTCSAAGVSGRGLAASRLACDD